MSMPGPGTHVAGVDYVVTFAELDSASVPAKFSGLTGVHFSFLFDIGVKETSPDVFTVEWDTSWFVQESVETDIAGTLDSVCQSVGALLGLPVESVQASVTVKRLWTMSQNSYTPIPGLFTAPQKQVITDVMTYPLQVSDTDAVTVFDTGETVTSI